MAAPLMQGQDTSYKPWGMMAGGMVGSREADTEAANMLALQESQLGNVIKGVEAGRASADYADPRMEALRQQGKMGEYQTQSAQGQKAMGTLQSDIAVGNSNNNLKMSDNEWQQGLNEIDKAQLAIESGFEQYGPSGWAQALQSMPPMLAEIAKKAGPEQFKQILPMIREKFMTLRSDTPANRGEMQKATQKFGFDTSLASMNNESAERRSAANNQATLGAANISAQNSSKVTYHQLRAQTMSQITAFEREKRQYAEALQEMKSDPTLRSNATRQARMDPNYPKNGSPMERKMFEEQSFDSQLSSSKPYKNMMALEGEIEKLRTQERELAAALMPQQASTPATQPSQNVINLD